MACPKCNLIHLLRPLRSTPNIQQTDNMIPPKTFRHVIFVTNLAWYCGAVPFRFVKMYNSPPARELVPSFTKLRSLIVYGTFFINFFYITYVAGRIFVKVNSGSVDTLVYVLTLSFKLSGYAQALVIQFNTLYKWKETPEFHQNYLLYFSTFKERFVTRGTWGPKCSKFFKAWYVIGFFVNLQNIGEIMRKPEKHYFLTSLMDDPKHGAIGIRFFFISVHFIVWFSSWSGVWAFVFHLYAYFCGIVWIVRELNIQTNSGKTVDSLRKPQYFATTSRSLHLLHHLWRNTYQSWLCPAHKFVGICVATLGSYGVIKLTGRLALIMGAMAIISMLYLATLFSKFGQLTDLSMEQRNSWISHQHREKRLWIIRFVRSIPIFRVKIGTFYYVKRTTIFSIFETVLNNTITLLLL